jgi:hypothetical protein
MAPALRVQEVVAEFKAMGFNFDREVQERLALAA